MLTTKKTRNPPVALIPIVGTRLTLHMPNHTDRIKKIRKRGDGVEREREERMAEVQMTADDNVSATGQQHTEQPEFINEGEVDQNAEQCHDICPLPAKLTDDKTTELSNQSLESENVCLKKTVAQCQKDFAKLEAHCINLELQMQNNVLKSGQQSQFLKEKSNEAKVKNDIDVTETINIELEHSVAKLLAENEQLHKEKEHLKQTYKDLFDSIKRTRVQTKDQNESLMAQLNKKSNENADVLAQIQKKGFAIAALKNELRKLTGNSVNTKFAKPSILGKPVGQPLKNQSVVRQPTAFNTAVQASVFMAMMSDHNTDQALVFMVMTSDHNRSELGIHDHNNEPSSSKLVPKVVPLAVKTATSRQELELLFHHHIAMLRTTDVTVYGNNADKIESKLEQSQQGVSNDVLFTMTNGNPSVSSSKQSTADVGDYASSEMKSNIVTTLISIWSINELDRMNELWINT
ncbi:hypothetical protein Tco_0213706 [Tanacetum coccineum]